MSCAPPGRSPARSCSSRGATRCSWSTRCCSRFYQFLLPSLLLGLTFHVGGRAIGLEASVGTDDLAGYLFLGTVVGGMVGAAFWDMAFGLKREMDAGTLEPTWLTPTRPETTVFGRAISGLILSALASAILVSVAAICVRSRHRRRLAGRAAGHGPRRRQP